MDVIETPWSLGRPGRSTRAPDGPWSIAVEKRPVVRRHPSSSISAATPSKEFVPGSGPASPGSAPRRWYTVPRRTNQPPRFFWRSSGTCSGPRQRAGRAAGLRGPRPSPRARPSRRSLSSALPELVDARIAPEVEPDPGCQATDHTGPRPPLPEKLGPLVDRGNCAFSTLATRARGPAGAVGVSCAQPPRANPSLIRTRLALPNCLFVARGRNGATAQSASTCRRLRQPCRLGVSTRPDRPRCRNHAAGWLAGVLLVGWPTPVPPASSRADILGAKGVRNPRRPCETTRPDFPGPVSRPFDGTSMAVPGVAVPGARPLSASPGLHPDLGLRPDVEVALMFRRPAPSFLDSSRRAEAQRAARGERRVRPRGPRPTYAGDRDRARRPRRPSG